MRKKKITEPIKIQAKLEDIAPAMIEAHASSTTSSRRNLAGTIERTDRFKNIDDGLVPFKTSSYGQGKSSVDVRDAVILCQKAYYNFAVVRNIIDLMTEFSVGDIYFRGGGKSGQDFFSAFCNKINMWNFQDQFYREYYRSGNVIIFRHDAEIQPADVKKITQVFGEAGQVVVEKNTIPARYTILNPADIKMIGTSNFSDGLYFKMLSDFELERIRNPQTEEDVAVFNSLPEEAQKEIKKGSRAIIIPLDVNKTAFVFYKKQAYEPFAVPMAYPVLEDISAKAEMKKIDLAIARTMQQIILVVTAGAEPDKGGINKNNLEALKALFANQSIGRVLVADYTTKAEFKSPAVSELLSPAKYEILDRDINIGLNNIFTSNEKFANQAQRVEIFVARLVHARKAFLNDFLLPEIKRISKSLGFKNFPTPYYEDVELKDNTNFAKIYARLMELGVLTPEEGFEAIQRNTLPDPSTLVESQEEFKKLRDKGLYKPLVGGAKEGDGAGRPAGPPSAPKKISPLGSGASVTEESEKYSVIKVRDNFMAVQELQAKVVEGVKKLKKLKTLNKAQKEVVEGITHTIIANEDKEKWLEKVDDYCKDPTDKNPERVNEINEIAARHDISHYLASVLYVSKT